MSAMRKLIVLAAAIVGVTVAGTAYAFSERGPSKPPAPSALQDTESPPGGGDGILALQQDGGADAEEDGDGRGAARHADLIAAEFGLPRESVIALQQQGIGWGAMFKLCSLARAMNVPVETLIANATIDANGEREFAFGELKRTLTPEQLAVLEAGPKNFGQLVSKSHKPDKAKPDRAP